MSNPLKESREDTVDSVRNMRDDNEYVRLVVAHEASGAETVLSLSQSEARSKKLMWWLKALVICVVALLLTLIFAKWGAPFVFEKVTTLLNFSSFSKFCFHVMIYCDDCRFLFRFCNGKRLRLAVLCLRLSLLFPWHCFLCS